MSSLFAGNQRARQGELIIQQMNCEQESVYLVEMNYPRVLIALVLLFIEVAAFHSV